MARWMSNTRYSSEVFDYLCHSYEMKIISGGRDVGASSSAFSNIPFAIGSHCLYFLTSTGARLHNSLLSERALRVEIASKKNTIQKIEYDMTLEYLPMSHAEWLEGFSYVTVRHGERVKSVGKMKYDVLYKLSPVSGRYYAADAEVYTIKNGKLSDIVVDNEYQDFSQYFVVS